MRKTPFTLTLILVLSMLLNVSSFAVYENGPQNIEYNQPMLKVILVCIRPLPILLITTLPILMKAETVRTLPHRLYALEA